MSDSDDGGQSLFFAKNMTNSQKTTLRSVAGLGLLALVLIGWWISRVAIADSAGEKSREIGSTAARYLPVKVMTAELVTSYERQQRFTGTTVAARRTELAFERAGRIVRLLVDEGDTVRRGQSVAELDRRHLTARRRRASFQLQEGEAVLAELVAGPRMETIAAAKANVRGVTAERDVAEKNLERRRRLVDTRAISQEEFDESFFQFRAIESRVDAAQKELDELLAGTRQEQIAAQRARVEQLRSELTDIDHDLEDTTLKAPFDGVIAERRLDEGAIVAAGAVVFGILENSPPELWIGIPANVAGQLSVGDPVTAEVEGEVYAARIRSVRPELDMQTRTQNLVLAITPSKDQTSPTPGQVARIVLPRVALTSGYWVPTQALTPRKRGLWAVYVTEGEGAIRTVAERDVELLYTDGERSLVRGALQRGEQLVATGGHRVVEGQKVTVVQAD